MSVPSAADTSSLASGRGMPAEPQSILRPASATEIREIVRDAIARKAPLRVIGRGTWLDAGRPVARAQAVSLEQSSGIVAYTPGDLTLTARAGTTLAEIAEATAEHDQWLALDPWGGDAGSLGATAATATTGPVSGTLGAPRDVVIGLEAVTGTGDIVRGGGRVVKNVAGFDLTRLMIGAWGTLGILSEVSVRLRGLPERDVTVALPVPAAGPALADLLTKLRVVLVVPLAAELVNVRLADHLGLGQQPVIVARLTGNAEAVAAQQNTLAQVGEPTEVASSIWNALRTADVSPAAVVRLSGPVARFPEVWKNAEKLAADGGGYAHGSVLRSTARVILPPNDGSVAPAALELLRAGTRNTRIFERLPRELWSALAPSAAIDRLSRRVRNAFDPQRILNPGILGEDVS